MICDKTIEIWLRPEIEPTIIETDDITKFVPEGKMWHYDARRNLIIVMRIENPEIRRQAIGKATEQYYITRGVQRSEVERFLRKEGIKLTYR